jgi:hypothetical protein
MLEPFLNTVMAGLVPATPMFGTVLQSPGIAGTSPAMTRVWRDFKRIQCVTARPAAGR